MAGYERQTAIPTDIATIVAGSFVKGEAQMQPSYVATKDGKKISRVHLIAVVVAVPPSMHSEATLDDGTGKIVARSFEDPQFFSQVQLGDIVRVVGKVRGFNEQIYLIPEIIKKIENKQWVALHKLVRQSCDTTAVPVAAPDVAEVPEAVVEEVVEVSSGDSLTEKILICIKETDVGDGAQTEIVIERIGEGSDKVIRQLLENGEIFEIRPGRLKVLD